MLRVHHSLGVRGTSFHRWFAISEVSALFLPRAFPPPQPARAWPLGFPASQERFATGSLPQRLGLRVGVPSFAGGSFARRAGPDRPPQGSVDLVRRQAALWQGVSHHFDGEAEADASELGGVWHGASGRRNGRPRRFKTAAHSCC